MTHNAKTIKNKVNRTQNDQLGVANAKQSQQSRAEFRIQNYPLIIHYSFTYYL